MDGSLLDTSMEAVLFVVVIESFEIVLSTSARASTYIRRIFGVGCGGRIATGRARALGCSRVRVRVHEH